MKQENLTLSGVVKEALGNSLFRVTMDINGSEVLAQISGRMRKFYIKILPGDKVKVEVSPYDLTRGRIVERINEQPVDYVPPKKKKK